jgi:hypothetical protein
VERQRVALLLNRTFRDVQAKAVAGKLIPHIAGPEKLGEKLCLMSATSQFRRAFCMRTENVTRRPNSCI